MSKPVPEPITAYFRAQNAHDVDGMLAAFGPGARVRDEGRELAGAVAIRAWIDDTTRKYQPSVTPLDVEEVAGRTVVKARVSGTFPGSPADLRFRFEIDGRQITALEIGG